MVRELATSKPELRKEGWVWVRRGGSGASAELSSKEDHYLTELFQASPGPQFHGSLLAACQKRVHSMRHRAICFP